MIDHMPTPWHSEEVRTQVGRCFKIGSPEMTKTDGKPSYVCVYDDWGHGDNVQSANAAFIVKAVNSHDALVKALKNARNCIDTLIVNSPDKKKRRNLGEFIREIDGALASIKERT